MFTDYLPRNTLPEPPLDMDRLPSRRITCRLGGEYQVLFDGSLRKTAAYDDVKDGDPTLVARADALRNRVESVRRRDRVSAIMVNRQRQAVALLLFIETDNRLRDFGEMVFHNLVLQVVKEKVAEEIAEMREEEDRREDRNRGREPVHCLMEGESQIDLDDLLDQVVELFDAESALEAEMIDEIMP